MSGKSHLVVPYTLDCNDMRFATPAWLCQRRMSSSRYLRDTFDVLYREGERSPQNDVGRDCTAVSPGVPAAASALERFLDHVQRHENVWICRRIDIARHWIAQHPPAGE